MSLSMQVTTTLKTPRRPRWLAGSVVVCLGLLTIATSSMSACAGDQPVVTQPAFQVDVSAPTTDKPQSKLWFAQGSWWAWLPTRAGSGIWRRGENGWQRQTSLDSALAGLPGRADVWADGDEVRAVLVAGRRLAVISLQFQSATGTYALSTAPRVFEVPAAADKQSIETATIARDGQECWWIAYPWQQRMWVRALPAGADAWSDPLTISEAIGADDLGTLIALPDGVGLAWSDQLNDAMWFRLHRDGQPIDAWQPSEVIERGNRTADDHLNAAVTSDGTLYLATKNSVDRVGSAQLVLRVRSPQGQWQNLPFAARTQAAEPSRPIVVAAGQPEQLYLLYTLYRRGGSTRSKINQIFWQSAPSGKVDRQALAGPAHVLIAPDSAVNNVTACKGHWPTGAPWIVLASDPAGRVYEGQIAPPAGE